MLSCKVSPWCKVSSESGQMKTALWMELLSKLPDRSNSNVSLAWAFWEAPILFCPVQWLLDCWTSQLPYLLSCWLSRPQWSWGQGRWDQHKLKHHTGSLLLRSHCFLNKYSSDCCKSVANFQGSEKVDIDRCGQCSQYFYVLNLQRASLRHSGSLGPLPYFYMKF